MGNMNHDLVIFKLAYVRNQAANFDKTVAFYITHTHTHIRLMALFQDYRGKPVPER